MIYLRLFYEFLQTGLFAVGGGLATLPFLYDISDRTGWFSYGQLADMIAISESTPGAIGVNMATYSGNMVAGIPGGIIATLGLITPSIVIIVIVAHFLNKFKTNEGVQGVFYGLRPASTALIAAAGFSVVLIDLVDFDLFRQTGSFIQLMNWRALFLAIVLYILANHIRATKQLHPVIFIAFAALVGIIFNFGLN
ncbi:chromate transporter [Amphibacillus marinus]|uniref:Chromate transporter n=1 Tax=Amphibacillus marinus TaxID=872970 RepID=A0A1H8GQP7_9BACI|nr:chromate transporter [Amphibacillus marinus]SEN46160.1 chromate transporter [Amphibacillus marinus]